MDSTRWRRRILSLASLWAARTLRFREPAWTASSSEAPDVKAIWSSRSHRACFPSQTGSDAVFCVNPAFSLPRRIACAPQRLRGINSGALVPTSESRSIPYKGLFAIVFSPALLVDARSICPCLQRVRTLYFYVEFCRDDSHNQGYQPFSSRISTYAPISPAKFHAVNAVRVCHRNRRLGYSQR